MDMKYLSFVLIVLISCSNPQNNRVIKMVDQQSLKNEKIRNHQFLSGMYNDSFFPEFLVDKCKNILLNACERIESESPKTLEELYSITHELTIDLNNLEDEFFENNSELETVAREVLAGDVFFISQTYGFEADIEELIAPRNW